MEKSIEGQTMKQQNIEQQTIEQENAEQQPVEQFAGQQIADRQEMEQTTDYTDQPCEKKEDTVNLKLDRYIREQFQIPDVDVRTYSPLTLAFIGDGIYDLIIRSKIVGEGNTRASQLHQHTSHLVKAASQSAMLEYMIPLMTEEEEGVYRRGRNAKSPTMAKNATMKDYRRATGFEALMGYLYLTDQMERLVELVKAGLAGLKEEELCVTKK